MIPNCIKKNSKKCENIFTSFNSNSSHQSIEIKPLHHYDNWKWITFANQRIPFFYLITFIIGGSWALPALYTSHTNQYWMSAEETKDANKSLFVLALPPVMTSVHLVILSWSLWSKISKKINLTHSESDLSRVLHSSQGVQIMKFLATSGVMVLAYISIGAHYSPQTKNENESFLKQMDIFVCFMCI